MKNLRKLTFIATPPPPKTEQARTNMSLSENFTDAKCIFKEKPCLLAKTIQMLNVYLTLLLGRLKKLT